MNAEKLQNYLNLKILKKQSSEEYRLQRPLTITITKKVIDYLKKIYIENGEKGGLFSAYPVGRGALVINDFFEVPNVAAKSYNYNPVVSLFNSVVNDIIQKGDLPFAIHTHPIKLGFEAYDSKRSKFYLKSSPQDRAIARAGLVPYFNFPEAIFVKDSRLKGGFGINFYTGTIFPASTTALTTLQWVSGGVALLSLGYNKLISAIGAGVFGFDFFRRPKYTMLANGDLRIDLSF
jgi:hypothetical protein